ncbi:MAG: hypothetical protein KY475_20785 [Planctomycetes bacterium]|nr:hypothetical protein [Planctomycetota bacterium]
MATSKLYIWKSGAATDEVSVGRIVRDPFGEQQRDELLSLHLDTMLDLFGAEVYCRLAAMTPDDEPAPLTMSIGVEEDALQPARRLSVQAPSGVQRETGRSAGLDRRA